MIPVVKNGEYIADIIGIGTDGEGVGRVDGFTLFVPGALPGERALVRVLKLKKQFGYAKLLEVLERSPERVEPPCAVFWRCGGCQLQHLSYAAQLAHKRRVVVDNLERIGGLRVRGGGGGEDILVHPTIGMSDPWRYRNKAQVPIGDVGGGLVGGFYAHNSHRIVDMDTCLIQHDRTDAIVQNIKEMARQLGISAYNDVTHSGWLRHVVVRIGVRTGEVMVVLVTNGENDHHADALAKRIRSNIGGIASLCQNINRERTNVIFGDRTKVLWGRDVIYDAIGELRFAISARSFYQVNSTQTKVLYDQALKYAALTGTETVIDAYCGIGTISLFVAKQAKQVFGIETVKEAIDDARRNADLNGIGNANFIVGKAEEVFPDLRSNGITPDVIIVDPPRKGCDASLLETIIAMKPSRVVYVSCNPSTLARDLRILTDGGFRVVEAQPVDMFPHTVHVETVVLMSRKDK